jgi:hypothetical protein
VPGPGAPTNLFKLNYLANKAIDIDSDDDDSFLGGGLKHGDDDEHEEEDEDSINYSDF